MMWVLWWPALSSSAQPEQPAVQLFKDTLNVPPHSLQWPPAPPYSHTVKDLGASATAAECQSKCESFRNQDVSPVSGWSLCMSFTFHDQKCVGIVDASEWEPKHVPGAVSGKLTWPPKACQTNADCSYNGKCEAKRNGEKHCSCRTSWTGDRCQTLALLPTKRDAGLRAVDDGKNTSTWGGAVQLEGHQLHMWASEMTHHCGIDSWTTNSHVVHATSTDGGFTFTRTGDTGSQGGSGDEVWPVFSHEPNVVRAPTGEWVMYWTSLEPDAPTPPQCMQCDDGNTPAAAKCVHAPGGSGPTYMSWSPAPTPAPVSSKYAPHTHVWNWSKPMRLFTAQKQLTNMDTNLAVVILRNGSAVGIGRTGGQPTGIVAHLVTAKDWKDPDSYTGRWTEMLFPDTKVLPDAGVEDPSLHVDEDGIFHAVFHNQIEADDERLCGGHAYSVDGITWTFTGTSWGNKVQFTSDGSDGSSSGSGNFTYAFSRRERPHLVFGDASDPFKITGLTTGVQFGESSPISISGEDACYTLFQPVAI